MEKINKLKSMGFSKWKIAKHCNVAWHTVHMWDRDMFKPTPDNDKKLDLLIVNSEFNQ